MTSEFAMPRSFLVKRRKSETDIHGEDIGEGLAVFRYKLYTLLV